MILLHHHQHLCCQYSRIKVCVYLILNCIFSGDQCCVNIYLFIQFIDISISLLKYIFRYQVHILIVGIFILELYEIFVCLGKGTLLYFFAKFSPILCLFLSILLTVFFFFYRKGNFNEISLISYFFYWEQLQYYFKKSL